MASMNDEKSPREPREPDTPAAKEGLFKRCLRKILKWVLNLIDFITYILPF